MFLCGRPDGPLYVYGIVHPDGMIYPIDGDKYKVWRDFFELNKCTYANHRLPLSEAIRAYEAIGYKKVKFSLVEMEIK